MSTTVDRARHWQKCSPSTPHEALRPAPSSLCDGEIPPEQVYIIFEEVEGVNNPQNTLMLR